MNLIKYTLICCTLVASSLFAADTEIKEVNAQEGVIDDKRQIIGWVERIKLLPEELLFDAKLTPGSEGNVIHAENIKQLKKKDKDAKDRVKFTLTDKKGQTKEVEAEISSESTFKTTKGAKEKRYKVKIGFCLAQTYLNLEFALADRKEYEHAVRIGRDALAGHFLIDPAATKSTVPECKS